jgi:integrase
MRGVLNSCAAMPIADLNRKLIIRGREDRKGTPAQANNFVKLMRGLCKWAVDDEQMKINPARDIEMLTVKTQGFPVWTEEDVESFRARWEFGTRERLALELLIAFGHRRGDVASVGRQHLVNGGTAVKIRTEKNNRSVVRSLTPEAVEAIKACPAKGMAFVAKADGNRLTKESFGNWFGEAARAAGVKKNAHGLRKYAATALTYAGATEAELDGAMGWTPGSKMSRVYTAERDDAIMAANVEQKLQVAKAKEARATKQETSYSQPKANVGNDVENKSNIR